MGAWQPEKESFMFKKNDIIPLKIESVTGEGSGVGHADGIAVFVPMTAAGDELKVRIVKVLLRHH